MQQTIIAAGPSACGSISQTSGAFVWAGALVVVGGIMAVVWLAGRDPMRTNVVRRRFGRALQVVGFLSCAASYAVALFSREHDACGHPQSVWISVSLAGLIAGLLGILMKNASEWAAIACITCLDIGLAISLMGGVRDGQRVLGAAVTILLVHGVCTGVATWWSWRARLAVRGDIRARASEAGRILAAAWLVLPCSESAARCSAATFLR